MHAANIEKQNTSHPKIAANAPKMATMGAIYKFIQRMKVNLSTEHGQYKNIHKQHHTQL